jgi:tetratricopeptide (TPR) repeat protein
MMHDQYGLALSTASAAAQKAFVEGSMLALTLYPGAVDAFDRAIAADPAFAMAHTAKAQMLMREAKVPAAQAAQAAATACAAGITAREASHIRFYDLAFAGRTEDAIAALREHLKEWPRDAMVLASCANPNGLIGASGRAGQKHQIAELLDSLAPHYGDDFWFLAHHAMALSEDGRTAAARPKIERSVAINPRNAHGAHGFAHVCYETNEGDQARAYLTTWLQTYPKEGFFHGHLSWHLSLCMLAAGDFAEAARLYGEAISLDSHSGGPQQKMSDGAAFLWRSELAGHPRDGEAWRRLHDYANTALPRPGSGLADLHVILAQAVMGDMSGLETRARQMEEMAKAGRYPSASYLPGLTRGFAAFEKGNHAAAVEAFLPFVGQNERIGGSRAQHDLIEFTLLKACLLSGREELARRLLTARRPGAAGALVAGIETLH